MGSASKATIFLFIAAVICNLHGADARACQLSDIHVSVAKTGKLVEGELEYLVTIRNTCSCPQAGVTIRCHGLSSVEPVDQSKIRTLGSPVTFTYAWKTPQDFTVVSARPQC